MKNRPATVTRNDSRLGQGEAHAWLAESLQFDLPDKLQARMDHFPSACPRARSY